MSMYLSQIHARASFPVNYGLLYWAFISGLHVINKWKMCSVPKIVCATYGALKDWTMQQLPKHCVCHSINTVIQPTDEIYY